jgi:hypothetical protein
MIAGPHAITYNTPVICDGQLALRAYGVDPNKR